MKKSIGVFLIVASALFLPKDVLAINLTEYIAGPNFVPHQLSTGEQIRYEAAGEASSKGSPVRMYKNNNYEQFLMGDWIYRREDTSWAPLPGFGDALCSSGGKAIYTLDAGCTRYNEGQTITTDGMRWAPLSTSVGATWNTDVHQVVTIKNTLDTGGARSYCSLSNLQGYEYNKACGASATLKLTSYYEPQQFTFCTGIKNEEPLIVIDGIAGPGAGDRFYYMRNWGLVGFEAPGFKAGLMGPGATTAECTAGNVTPPKEFELREVACDQTYSTSVPNAPDFHSLRPYPASPCKKDPEPTYFMCGNDLVVKETLKFDICDNGTPILDDAGQTIGIHCDYNVTSSSSIAMGLNNANFPIMGNTELVPNSTNTTNPVLPLSGKGGFLTRVNEYVSWYLNGIPYRAEEKSFDGPTLISDIINLAGPLKKLLPRDVQTSQRNDERDTIGTERHNQIVSCANTDDPEACYSQSQKYNRITDVPRDNPSNQSFPYIPFSSTEDRIGEARIDVRPLGTGTCNPAENPNSLDPSVQSGVTCLDFTAQETTKQLYFPHIEENNELGTILQNTYKPQGLDDKDTAPKGGWDALVNTPYCELVESRTNPGDKLYGELARNGEQPIQGSMTYKANLECDFMTPSADAILTCQTNCGPDVACQTACAQPQATFCEREIFVPFSVQILTPELKTTWEKFVAGSQSIVKRIFPFIQSGAPIEELKDIPGESNAAYSSNNIGVSGGGLSKNEGLAGNPAAQRTGSTAKIYFPHIGSVYDYFLQGIHKALTPYGITYEGGIDPTEAICEINNSGIQSQELRNIISAAANWAKVPVQALITVARVEGRCRDGAPANSLCSMTDAEVLQYSAPGAEIPWNCPGGGTTPNAQVAKGPMQFYHGTTSGWGLWASAVNQAPGADGRTPNICNVKDSIYAAAWVLSSTYSGSHCPRRDYPVANTPTASWTTQEMERALLSWSINATCQPGLSNINCATLGSSTLSDSLKAIGRTYCNYFNSYYSQIQTSCN